MRIKSLIARVSGLLAGAVILASPLASASTFTDHLWQFTSGGGANIIDFNKGLSGIWDNGELTIATDNFMFLDAGHRVTVTNALFMPNGPLVVTNAAQVGTLNAVGNVNVGGTVNGTLTGNASTATALAADPADCSTSTHFAVGVTAAGAATCEAIADADVPNSITVDLATSASGLTLTGSSTNVTGNLISDGSLIAVKAGSLTDTNQGGVRTDFTPTAGFGSTTSADPVFGVGVYGNLLGANLTGTANYLGGVYGKYSLTGTNASTYPVGAVLGGIGDGTSTADGAFVAFIDGDSSVTTAGAAFKVMHNNSNPGSGFTYGLDLFDAAHDGYDAVSFATADIRLASGATISSGSTTPATCVTGSLFLDTDGGADATLRACTATDTWTAVSNE